MIPVLVLYYYMTLQLEKELRKELQAIGLDKLPPNVVTELERVVKADLDLPC